MSDLHVRSPGVGTPTVLLESGIGNHSTYWGEVPERIARFTNVVCYDRRGLGLGRLPSVRRRVRAEFSNFSPEQVAAIVADQASPRYWLANRAELRVYATFREHIRAASLPDVPIVYLTATAYSEQTTRVTFAMSATEFHAFHLGRQRAALEKLGTRTEQVAAEKSGHLIQHDEPELIVAAVERLVDRVRTSST